MPHLTTADARTFTTHGVTFTSYASSATGSREIAAWRADFAAGTPGQAHTMTREEIVHVLSGALEVEVDDDRFTARAGDTVLVPAGAVFRVSPAAGDPARAWVTTRLGMTATMAGDGSTLVPPWAQ